MEKFKRLPDAELDVMKELWAAGGPLTRPALEARLTEKGWASTTLLALLSRLEAKGFVARQKQGKGYLYSAAVARADYLPAESRWIAAVVYTRWQNDAGGRTAQQSVYARCPRTACPPV